MNKELIKVPKRNEVELIEWEIAILNEYTESILQLVNEKRASLEEEIKHVAGENASEIEKVHNSTEYLLYKKYHMDKYPELYNSFYKACLYSIHSYYERKLKYLVRRYVAGNFLPNGNYVSSYIDRIKDFLEIDSFGNPIDREITNMKHLIKLRNTTMHGGGARFMDEELEYYKEREIIISGENVIIGDSSWITEAIDDTKSIVLHIKEKLYQENLSTN